MSTPNSQNIDELSEQDLALISACLDNQLPQEELTAFKKRLLQDPTLNAHYQQFKKMDEQIKQHITSIDNTPIPQAVNDMLDIDSKVSNNEIATNEKDSTTKTSSRIFALAATIAAVGILSYQAFTPDGSQPNDIAQNHLQPIESEQVNNTLSNSPSMNINLLGEEGKMVVLQSFYNTQGHPCREYQLANDTQTQHAIACYQQNQWTNVVNTLKSKQSTQQYQTASSEDPQQIINYLNKIEEQKIINKQQESNLINSNWN